MVNGYYNLIIIIMGKCGLIINNKWQITGKMRMASQVEPRAGLEVYLRHGARSGAAGATIGP
jgi:hypothetical protein